MKGSVGLLLGMYDLGAAVLETLVIVVLLLQDHRVLAYKVVLSHQVLSRSPALPATTPGKDVVHNNKK